MFKIASLVGLAGLASGHVLLAEPRPQQNPGDPSPINGKNRDYCGYAQDFSVAPAATLVAGQVFNVRFGNPNVDPATANPEAANQARHGGGFCEFSLSYDQGASFHVVARYLRSCPDVFFDWPFLVPEDAPAGQALFAWTWFPHLSGAPEMYMDCSVVEVQSSTPADNASITAFEDKYCPILEGNLGGSRDFDPIGDGSKSNTVGRGPIAGQQERNVSGAVVTCENGAAFDFAASMDPSDVDGLIQRNTNGESGDSPKVPKEPEPVPAPEPVDPQPEPQPVPAPEPVDPQPEPEPVPAPEPVDPQPVPEPVPAPEPVDPQPEPEPVPAPEPVDPQPEPEPVPAPEPVDPAPVPVPAPEPADPQPVPSPPAIPGYGEPIGYCNPDTPVTCIPNDPAIYYQCRHGALVPFAVSEGTACICDGAENDEGGCIGRIDYADAAMRVSYF